MERSHQKMVERVGLEYTVGSSESGRFNRRCRRRVEPEVGSDQATGRTGSRAEWDRWAVGPGHPSGSGPGGLCTRLGGSGRGKRISGIRKIATRGVIWSVNDVNRSNGSSCVWSVDRETNLTATEASGEKSNKIEQGPSGGACGRVEWFLWTNLGSFDS
ncbi:hypothetical protein PIB30_020698 [Stylosanthes scabra]|uniref:Uncharacterized protein n=1 Tax=Stylosanthes scabra TaxID=79078 RepID=A0ABU6X8J3_9FABA|nr:hypothetical protein [Stylosanthes scabra]